ncbi:hypothetical protein BH10PSE12_BH10PSE12_14740 [soil metagenome]
MIPSRAAVGRMIEAVTRNFGTGTGRRIASPQTRDEMTGLPRRHSFLAALSHDREARPGARLP